jgi:hypothetical protein
VLAFSYLIKFGSLSTHYVNRRSFFRHPEFTSICHILSFVSSRRYWKNVNSHELQIAFFVSFQTRSASYTFSISLRCSGRCYARSYHDHDKLIEENYGNLIFQEESCREKAPRCCEWTNSMIINWMSNFDRVSASNDRNVCSGNLSSKEAHDWWSNRRSILYSKGSKNENHAEKMEISSKKQSNHSFIIINLTQNTFYDFILTPWVVVVAQRKLLKQKLCSRNCLTKNFNCLGTFSLELREEEVGVERKHWKGEAEWEVSDLAIRAHFPSGFATRADSKGVNSTQGRLQYQFWDDLELTLSQNRNQLKSKLFEPLSANAERWSSSSLACWACLRASS